MLGRELGIEILNNPTPFISDRLDRGMDDRMASSGKMTTTGR